MAGCSLIPEKYHDINSSFMIVGYLPMISWLLHVNSVLSRYARMILPSPIIGFGSKPTPKSMGTMVGPPVMFVGL